MAGIFELEVEIVFENEKIAHAAFKSVKMEQNQKHEKRSKTSMNINKNVVFLKIIAADSMALKASMNSYLNLLALSREISEVF